MSWTGFGIGAQGGYGWGSSDEVFFNGANTAAVGHPKRFTGGFAGGVGYNWQTGAFPCSASKATITGPTSAAVRHQRHPPNLGDTYFTKLRGFGDVKGHGFPLVPRFRSRAVPSLSGGAAVGDLQHRQPMRGPGNVFVQNETRVIRLAPASNTCLRRTGAASSSITTSISARARSSTPPVVTDPSGTNTSTPSRPVSTITSTWASWPSQGAQDRLIQRRKAPTSGAFSLLIWRFAVWRPSHQ